MTLDHLTDIWKQDEKFFQNRGLREVSARSVCDVSIFRAGSSGIVDKMWIEYVNDMILLWNSFPSSVQ